MEALTAIGFDVGGTRIKAGVVRYDATHRIAELADVVSVETISLSSIQEFVALIGKLINSFRHSFPGIRAVGVGFPAIVDWHKGIPAHPPNIPWWGQERFPLRDVLIEQLGMPVSLDNDANVAAYAETILGYGQQWSSFLFVTLGTGVGGAIVLGNRLYRGERGCAGELGHIIVDIAAPLESPTFRSGILERAVGRIGIIERARQKCQLYPDSALLTYGQSLDVEHIGKEAQHGDCAAIETLTETAHILGAGIASALAVVGLHRVVVAGGIANLPEPFFDELQATLRQRALPPIAAEVAVVRSQLGSFVGVIGAALQVLAESQGNGIFETCC
ncbi:MAG: ROK family protein [Chlorobi bacterium]|nr:ROK family protein [Chlorobiota bacterium]